MKTMKLATILTTTLVMAMALTAGCGKKNESGKNSYNPYYNQLGSYPGVVGTGSIPAGVVNNYAQLIFQSLPCISGGQRAGLQFGLNMSAAVNATYVGITSEGDIAIITSNGGQAVMQAFICMRPEFGSGSSIQPQVVNNSAAVGRSLAGCVIDEISAATVRIPSYTGYLTLNFRPIHYGAGMGHPYAQQFQSVLQQLQCRYGY